MLPCTIHNVFQLLPTFNALFSIVEQPAQELARPGVRSLQRHGYSSRKDTHSWRKRGAVAGGVNLWLSFAISSGDMYRYRHFNENLFFHDLDLFYNAFNHSLHLNILYSGYRCVMSGGIKKLGFQTGAAYLLAVSSMLAFD
jgi:hypothetical protein